MNEFHPCNLREVGFIEDVKPIRSLVFHPAGEFFAVGTNSKKIKICAIHSITDKLLYKTHN